ncbi:MAG TPA: hypothetical protein PK990_10295 [Salinivirgaceae bacterium]|nr:hypothetical protein [Salinivirgaceae bacterium]
MVALKRLKPILIALAVSSMASRTNATNYLQTGNAYAAGLGNSVIAFPKAGFYQNQALLCSIDSLYIELYSSIPNHIKEFGNYSFFAATPALKGYTAIHFGYFGYEHYNESKLGLAYALKLSDKISTGVQFNWLRTSISEPYGNYNQFIAEVGFSYQIIHTLNWGVHLYNPTLSKPVDDNLEKPVTAIRTGIAYSPMEQITLMSELVQQINQKTSFRAGIDMEVSRNLNLQVGYNHQPKTLHVGAGLEINSLRINLSIAYHNLLGLTPHFSIGKFF